MIVMSYSFIVAGRLADEIKQDGPFSSPQAEAVLNILRTAEAILQSSNLVLKPFDLTLTQFNVLRVLRDAGARGIACSELGERLVARDPDVTRLLDRMEQKHLVHRDRSHVDRRVVVATITRGGLKALKEAEGSHYRNMERIMAALSSQEILILTENLERVRVTTG